MRENAQGDHILFARPGKQKPSGPKCRFHPLENHHSALRMSAHSRWHFLGESRRRQGSCCAEIWDFPRVHTP